MKKIGFLSFGHWVPSSQSQTRSAADTLLQSIELAIAAEELGADGAHFRVHHFAPARLAFPLAGSRRREDEPPRSCSASGSVGRHTSSQCQGMLAVLRFFL
jgi:alkanesulfonate monooxygenase SsuD/methylene tetrahydromethanopterin reductase-like flavin-dependent oxidoreductase (luciferase family)